MRSIILAKLTHPVSDKETRKLTHLVCQHMESRTVSHSKLTLTNFTETDGFFLSVNSLIYSEKYNYQSFSPFRQTFSGSQTPISRLLERGF